MQALEHNIKEYFGVMEPEVLKRMVDLFELEHLPKDRFFIKPGRICNRMSFVHSGILRIFAHQSGQDVTQWISTEGYFITDLSSFVLDRPARWNIQALTDVTLLTLNKERYKELNELVPEWVQLEKMFIAKCFTVLEERIFSHLSMTAEERYRSFFKDSPALFNQVPLRYIASMLGMSAETFSRVRKKLSSANS